MEISIKTEYTDGELYRDKEIKSNFIFVNTSDNNGTLAASESYADLDLKIKKEKDTGDFNLENVEDDYLKPNEVEKIKKETIKTEEIYIKSENEYYMTPDYSFEVNRPKINTVNIGPKNVNSSCFSEGIHKKEDEYNTFNENALDLSKSASNDANGKNDIVFNSMKCTESNENKMSYDNPNDYDNRTSLNSVVKVKQRYECNDCGEEFCNKKVLREHIISHNNESSKKFNESGKGVSNTQNEVEIGNSLSETRPYKCLTCGREFTYSSNLKRHMQLHTGERPFKCNLCNKGFRERHSLEKHMPTHFREKSIECELCNKQFSHENYLQKHLVIHNKKPKITDNEDAKTTDKDVNRSLFCAQCKMQFEKHEDYAIHVISHNPQTIKHKKKCNECGEQFHSTKNLEKHVKLHHKGKKQSENPKRPEELTLVNNLKVHTDTATGTLTFICKICDEVFDRSYKLRDHMNVHDSDKSYKCNECGQKFASIPYLRKHSAIHATERPHQCAICNRGFHRRSNLEIHMRTHFDDRPYKCDKCDNKTFTSLSGLNRHKKIHEGPYDCPVCNKKFNSESLKVHMLLHTGEKSFACHICNKRFAVSNYLKVHIRVKHTGERPYQCTKCDKNYTQSAHLRSHMKVHNEVMKMLNLKLKREKTETK